MSEPARPPQTSALAPQASAHVGRPTHKRIKTAAIGNCRTSKAVSHIPNPLDGISNLESTGESPLWVNISPIGWNSTRYSAKCGIPR